MTEIRFDDQAALESKISDEWGPFGPEMEISQELINQFADITSDHQWIHIDIERCKKESPFGGPIAHGFLTLSLLPHLIVEDPDYRVVGHSNVTNYGADKLRFLSPVPAGAKLHGRSRMRGARVTRKGTRVERECAIHVVGSERPALLYSSLMLFQAPPK